MNKPLHVLRVIASVNPEQGGPVEGLKRSAALLAARGHTTDVVTFDDPTAPYLADFPFRVYPQGPPKNRYGYTPRLTPWVRDNLDRFDVAVIHGLWNYSGYGAWRALCGGKLPYVVFTHGMLDPWFNSVQPVKRWAKQAYWSLIQGPLLAGANAVLFTSEEERRLSRTAFWGHSYRERVVAYGSGDAPDRPAEQKAAFAERAPKLGDRPYVLFLSRIHPKKGCDLLVSAFAQLAKAYPDIDLVIAGPDQVGLKAELQALAGREGIIDRIHFPGMLQNDAKWGAFRGASAFVLPSHSENFGIVVAEAMACSTPVLISDKVNIWREIQESGGGLVASDTFEGTRKLLADFLTLSQEHRKEMGIKARACYDASFSVEGATNDLESALYDAVKGARR